MSGGLIALGANLQHRGSGPQDVLLSALSQIHSAGLGIIAHSSFYRTPAWPAGSGPDFVNACAHLDVAGRTAAEVLSVLHGVEGDLGRERRQRWAARTCDLDLLAIGQQVVPDRPTVARWMALPAERQQGTAPDGLVLPHPRLHERAFVLVPLADVAPDWRHPLTGQSVLEMLEALAPEVRDQPLALP